MFVMFSKGAQYFIRNIHVLVTLEDLLFEIWQVMVAAAIDVRLNSSYSVLKVSSLCNHRQLHIAKPQTLQQRLPKTFFSRQLKG